MQNSICEIIRIIFLLLANTFKQEALNTIICSGQLTDEALWLGEAELSISPRKLNRFNDLIDLFDIF